MATGERRRLGRLARRKVAKAVADAEARTGLEFCVYLGATGDDDPHRTAEGLFVQSGLPARPAVLLLVAVDHHRVEILTAPDARRRVPDEECARAIDDMRPHLVSGRLADALVAGIGHLAAVAGPGTRGEGPRLPDVVGD